MRAGHFVHEVTINVEKRGAIRLYVHHMVPPDFVEQGHWAGIGGRHGRAGQRRRTARI